MDEQQITPNRPNNPRRKQRSKIQVFKETYLPLIIIGVAVLVVLALIIGAIVRAVGKSNAESEESIAAESSALEAENLLQEEAANVMLRAEALAEEMDYDAAIAALDSFSGDMVEFPDMLQMRDELVLARSQMVLWDDPGKVLHLSVQMLIADPERAFNDDSFASSFRKNFMTTEEFTRVLSILYDSGYMLVNTEDLITTTEGPTGGQIYASKPLYLPQGRTPLLLTQTNVNYPNYLIDSDWDNIPDKGGCGFASKLIVDDNGKLTCEYVDAEGNTLYGAYDMVPILEDFITSHPDFSYKGARATIAVSGYEGLFGHRTDPDLESKIGTAAYEAQLDEIRNIANTLTQRGYKLACFTYNDESYATMSATEISADLTEWVSEIVPIIGSLDTFVYARDGDIADSNTSYMGEKYQHLSDAGFRIFYGFCTDGTPWCMIEDTYVRMGRVLLTPANLVNNNSWFPTAMASDVILDPNRGDISG